MYSRQPSSVTTRPTMSGILQTVFSRNCQFTATIIGKVSSMELRDEYRIRTIGSLGHVHLVAPEGNQDDEDCVRRLADGRGEAEVGRSGIGVQLKKTR